MPMSFTALRRTCAVGALSALALGALPGTALAQEQGSPVELEVALSGPSEGVAGGSGSVTISVANRGQSAAPRVRVTLEVPAGIEVASVRAVDGWTCVLGPLSCELQGGLPPGQAAPALPVELSYAEDASGRKDLLADAYQGEGSGAMRIDRATASITISPPPPPPPSPSSPSPSPSPEPAPSTAAPGPATSQPAAPAPVRTTTRAATTRTATTRAATTRAATTRTASTTTTATHAPATAQRDVAAALAAPQPAPAAAPAAVPSAAVPQSLPFVEETAPAAPADEARDADLALRPVADDGVDGWLVALFVAAFVVFGYCLVVAIAKSRRGLV